MKSVTCIAPVNIAVIKYWGKRDEDLILPLNDSISTTLNVKHMCAKTTISISPDFEENTFYLNGVEQPFETSKRLMNCVKQVKSRADSTLDADFLSWKLHIDSENNFPTAAGLASSAAGFACVVSALAKIFNVSDRDDISRIARIGSGSACRSVYGGFVQWHRGLESDGSDSFASQIASANHWPQIRIIVLVVNDARKKDSSTSGMQRSVETSPLLEYRKNVVVIERTEAMKEAIRTRNFPQFAAITMQDSNQFHAICMDTYPPCFYLNDVSRDIIEMVHAYNRFKGVETVAYTFDAGPNACLYVLDENLQELMGVVDTCFPPPQGGGDNFVYHRGDSVQMGILTQDLKNALLQNERKPGALKYIICTNIGEGPKIL